MSKAASTGQVVTVAAVTYNSARDLPAYFEALGNGWPTDTEMRLVIADNGSQDDTVEIARSLRPDAVVLSLEQNRGYAAGVNAVLRQWQGDGPVLVLNPHVRLQPGCVEALLKAMEKRGTGIAVPRLVDGSGRTRASLRREPSVARTWGEALLGGERARRFAMLSEVVAVGATYDHEHLPAWATGAALLLSPTCIRVVGEWDESFFMYSEEADFALRSRDAGLRTRYVPSAVAVHLDAGTTEQPDLWARQALSKVQLYAKRHGRTATAAFTTGVVMNEALRCVRGGTKHRAALEHLLLRRHRDRVNLTTAPAHTGGQLRSEDAGRTPDIICFSAQDWWYHNRAHSDFQLLRRMAPDGKVLFVNSIGMRMPLPGRSTQPLRRVVRKAASIARFHRAPLPEHAGFHVLSPLVIPFYGSSVVRGLNTRLVTWQVALVSRLLGFRKPSCVVTIPTAWPVAQRLDVASIVYNRSDKHSEFGETDQDYIRSLELGLLQGADRVVYVSRALMASEAALTQGRARFLDHGVDLELFQRTDELPPEVAGLARPRMGFFGGFDDYVVDMELLEVLAKSIPEAELVLIGDSTCSMENLTSQPNVHWLGYRPYEQIPALGSSFDVALMPWLRNAWIEACNPIKLKEYLALGLPVVSTDFPEVRHYSDVVHIADDHETFIALVRSTLLDGGRGTSSSRRDKVANSSWERRAAELTEICLTARSVD